MSRSHSKPLILFLLLLLALIVVAAVLLLTVSRKPKIVTSVYRPVPAPPPSEFWYAPKAPPATARSVPVAEREASACYQAYDRFYHQPTVEIAVVFGYKDARPARFVGDRYERSLFVSYVVAPCHDGATACGFQRTPEDSELFVKQIEGPDGEPRTVRLRIVQSSVGPDDVENRKDSFQRWQSEHAMRRFLRSLGTADAVLYDGHSRLGGGPDFEPPRLAQNGHVDYGWYDRNKPGLTELTQTLRSNRTNTKLLGLFSCVSERHFLEEIQKADANVALITHRRLLYYTDAVRSLLGALSALLGQWCAPDFHSAIKAGGLVESTQLTGFFSP